MPSPDTDFNDDILTAVSAVSPANAWAVGLVKQSGFKSGHPLIVRWNGTGWATVASPAGLTGALRAISADSASDVWAVGDDSHGHAISVRFAGTSWVTVPLPALSGFASLQGVRAFSPTNVWAVGAQVPNSLSTQSKTLVLHWNGSAWSRVPSPSPDPNSNALHAIDGVATNNLWAVGQKAQDETTTGVPPGTRTLIVRWNGTSWSPVSSPNTGDQDTLNGVAAIAPSSVAAVGTDENTSGSIPIDRTLALGWNGTSWAGVATPNVGSTDNLLQGASRIPGTATAWAVGFHLTTGGPNQTLILKGP